MPTERARDRGLITGEVLELCLAEVFTAEVEVGRKNKFSGCGPST